MSDWIGSAKAVRLTADGAIFGGPCRILSIYFVSTVAAGSIAIRDGGATGTIIATFDTPVGGTSAGEPAYYQIDMPGQGLHCATSGYADLTTVDKVTILYG
jgi:hypothetical protein